ncbi:MAG: hypothetical protein AAFN50_09180 [Pseudomonadota bacterium]
MKNLLLIFLLANILYFMWASFTEEEPQRGVAIVDEHNLGPPLDVRANRDSDSVASVGAVLGAGEATAMEAVVGRTCVSVGQYSVIDDADTVLLELRGEGFSVSRRQADGEKFIGHWVQIRNIPDLATANAQLAILQDGGLTDAYYVETEQLISLGLFGELDGAEKIELEAQSLGLAAEILPRMSPVKVYFIDVGLPPGRGASAIVERYGEDMVLMREAATCPP